VTLGFHCEVIISALFWNFKQCISVQVGPILESYEDGTDWLSRNVRRTLPLYAAWYPQESQDLETYFLNRNQYSAYWVFDPFALCHTSVCPQATDAFSPWRLTTWIRIVLFLRVIRFYSFYMRVFLLISARLTALWSVSKPQTCQITWNMWNKATTTTDRLH
jgi:hypothetical protein